MLTIVAMVRVGPWVLQRIDVLGSGDERFPCERCDTKLREIWVCEVDEGADLRELDGQRTWRIGSTCGPTLLSLSDEVWHEETRVLRSRLGLSKRLVRLLAAAQAQGHSLPTFVTERLEPLLQGTMSERERKQLGNVMSHHEVVTGLKKKR